MLVCHFYIYNPAGKTGGFRAELWPAGCFKCTLASIGAAHSTRLKLCSSALLAFHCLRPGAGCPPAHPWPASPPARQPARPAILHPRKWVNEKITLKIRSAWCEISAPACVILIKLLPLQARRRKKCELPKEIVTASTSIPFSNTLARSNRSCYWILRVSHVTHLLIGRGSLIRWRASFVNVKGILSARSAPKTPIQIHASVQGRFGAQKSPNDDGAGDIVRW